VHIVRFISKGRVTYGTIENEIITSFRGSPFPDSKGRSLLFEADGGSYHLEEVKLLAPCLPSKVVCLGLNYRSHAEEVKIEIPRVPLIFLKPSTAVIGTDDTIVLPRFSTRVDYEGELGIVIGKKAKDVPEDEAGEFILGYTCFNDVTERHIQKDDRQWTRAKSFDTFAPIGPCIETEIDPSNLRLETYLNDELRQSICTSDLIFDVPRLVNFISSVMTLLPGDVIATGTPSGIDRMSAGDVVEVRIEKIGILRNRIIAQD